MEMENALLMVVPMVQILVNLVHTLMSAAIGICMNLFHCSPSGGNNGGGTAAGHQTSCLLSLFIKKYIKGSGTIMSCY